MKLNTKLNIINIKFNGYMIKYNRLYDTIIEYFNLYSNNDLKIGINTEFIRCCIDLVC